MTKVLPISEVKARLPELVAGVQEREEEIVVTRNGRAAAVLLNVDEYERLKATLEVLSDPELMRQIRQSEKFYASGGKGLSFEEVFDDPPAVRSRHSTGCRRGHSPPSTRSHTRCQSGAHRASDQPRGRQSTERETRRSVAISSQTVSNRLRSRCKKAGAPRRGGRSSTIHLRATGRAPAASSRAVTAERVGPTSPVLIDTPEPFTDDGRGMSGHDADVVVVGAGIVGAAIAYYLARRGLRVVVVERASVAGEQSRKNWGFVRQQGRDPLEVPLVMEANRIWRGLERELDADVEWTAGGNLALAADEARMARFEQWLPVAREFGLETRLLRGADLKAVVPGLGGSWVGGMHTPGDGHADPEKTTDAFAKAARTHGATIQFDCAVQGVTTSAGAVSGVVTERGEIRASSVVCAAGAWSSRLMRTLGFALPQRWVRGTVARTTPAQPITSCGVWGQGVAFRQRRDGSFNIAAGGALDHDVTLDSLRQVRFFLPNYWKNKALFRFHFGRPLLRSLRAALPGSAARRRPLVWDRGVDPVANPAKVQRSLAELQRVLPELPKLAVARSWAGYIDATPDLVPVLGEVPGLSGFVVATGFSGHGFAMGPIAGRLVSELIVDGKTSLDIAGFRFSRFAEGAIGQPRSVL